MPGRKTASPANSEWLTRRTLVDPQLSAAGWRVVPFDSAKPLSELDCSAIVEYPTDNGPSDYALCVAGRILGIVEAKKLSLGPQNVLTQAERYSRGISSNPLRFGSYHVPFLYSTNGEAIWHHDIRHEFNRSRPVAAFHSPAALQEKLQSDFGAACRALLALPNDHTRLRDYQIECNGEIEKAIDQRKRHMLVAMATGTGKTFTMVNEVYRLMKSGVARRILFLVDRRALAAQAVRSFASFEPEPGLKFDKIYEVYSQRFQAEDFDENEKFDPKVLPNSYLTDSRPGTTFLYVSTIQRMTVNLFGKTAAFGDEEGVGEDDAIQLPIPIHAFDVIIADECHRGYTASELAIWRATLDHFDAVKIGLTATPAAHTTTYFRDVVFRYEYERAVREGHLVDYDLVAVRSEVRMNGTFLKEGELIGRVDTETGSEQMDYLEDERNYDAAAVERDVTVPDSNRKILQEIKKYAEEHEQRYGRFPKTLIFAANDLPHTSHADQLVEMVCDVFGQGDSFARKITGRVDRPLQRIREFRNRPQPSVAVTVDLLSTGVDIPDLEFIVFLRPVKSRILFEQMLGRGTRKGERWKDKSHFTVFDCFDGTLLAYFRNATAITAEKPAFRSRTIAEIVEDIWQNRDREYNVRCLIKRLQRIAKEMSGTAREQFSAFIPDGDMERYAEGLPESLRKDFTGAMNLLRNKEFQGLLVNYHRPERTFLRGYEAADQVSSVWMVRDVDGNDYKPEDYLTAFSRYITEHENDIEAVSILLKRPAGWSMEALTELRHKLVAAPMRFSEEKLQKAHELTYHKAMVDIISMVKHAAREDEELYTAQERVQRAMMRISGNQAFTPEQMEWLDRIRIHLVQNLSISRDDFDDIPVFSHVGGWGRANKAFAGQLPELLKKINEAIAA
ncbi:type I restriction-modification enzyme R subunit C-terminal domain-containing protein [Geobacter benzoatilyticus]|uniref:DEAD/DEAH box helicase family protein n=1 Tax=Geobacter benzoatilyticus TaxID=2815309 RepID=A0ABX7PZP1_9BACT|nr:type I restriction-modification enzyme R subunit C-terminal domain-containing protein [Geobacter benzoatilyticus]QSV44608.1 DEAD/DEAH box helicase family protein [Geobacter benzoatilyticus]